MHNHNIITVGKRKDLNMWRSMPAQEIGARKKFEEHQTKERVLKSVEFDTS